MIIWQKTKESLTLRHHNSAKTSIMEYNIEHRTLHFKQPAGTSRGVYHTRDVWFIHLNEGEWHGMGECAPLPDLSCDAYPSEEYEQYLHAACTSLCQTIAIYRQSNKNQSITNCINYAMLKDYPSILFGLESALSTHPAIMRESGDSNSAEICCIPAQMSPDAPLCRINGLVWMGTYEEMKVRLEEKLQAGYHCIKLKIGAINFEEELDLIKRIRTEFSSDTVELRVDANGAFGTTYTEAIDRLHRLAQYDIHSIEQPIRQGHWQEMARLTDAVRNPKHGKTLPIALDEELIGINTTDKKIELLDTIRPQYIILKPMLHGSFSGCDEWIRLAEERNIGWWATSALESNVGLSAIARWVSKYHPTMPQGLGTGLLFTDNTVPHTEIRGDELFWIG